MYQEELEYMMLEEQVMKSLNEAYEKHAHFELLDVDKLIKKNKLREITNPIFFVRDNIPTSDGLLSNEIFGITKDQRANIFAYIDLSEYFLHPLTYIIWNSIDKKLSEVVNGTNTFIIDKDGQFVEDENGDNGIKWLKDNMDKIKFKHTSSSKRDIKIKFLEETKDRMFIKQMLVIPAYYRDINNTGGYVTVGEINKIYNQLILAVRSLKETADYGLNMSNATRGRIQNIIVKLYQWFTGTSNDKEAGKGLSGKYGIIRRSVLSKTTDYGTRLVLSAPELKVESLDDMKTNLDYTCIPLASLCSNLFPFIIFWIRRYFENEFSILEYPIINKKGEVERLKLKDPLIEFSDTRIKEEIERFMKGFSNRFIPIKIPLEDKSREIYMKIKGYNNEMYNSLKNNNTKDSESFDQLTTSYDSLKDNAKGEITPLFNRRLTWCDLIFMACEEASKDKHVIITRYPMDSYFNQFPTKIRVSSTKETEPIYVNNTFYRYYPKIRDEDIGKDTSNKFIDTLNLSNLYLDAIGGDYDGDQVTAKVAFTKEANEELSQYIQSKKNYIDLGAQNARKPHHEAIQSLYSLTIHVPGNNITKEVKLGKL